MLPAKKRGTGGQDRRRQAGRTGSAQAGRPDRIDTGQDRHRTGSAPDRIGAGRQAGRTGSAPDRIGAGCLVQYEIPGANPYGHSAGNDQGRCRIWKYTRLKNALFHLFGHKKGRLRVNATGLFNRDYCLVFTARPLPTGKDRQVRHHTDYRDDTIGSRKTNRLRLCPAYCNILLPHPMTGRV